MQIQEIYDCLKNPRFYETSNRYVRAKYDVFSTFDKSCRLQKSDVQICLDGEWAFKYFESLEERNEDFLDESFEFDKFIDTPSLVELNGYGTPQYVNVQYPWDGLEEINNGDLPSKIPTAQYVKQIYVEKEQNKKYELQVDGIEVAYNIWVNGKYVGYSEDSQTTSFYDISKYLNEDGNNIISIEVYKYSTATWLQDQDCWRMFGIHRSIYINVIDEFIPSDIFIVPTYKDKYTNASIDCEITSPVENDIEIYVNEEKLFSCSIKKGKNILKIPIENPILWSAENPYLYRLKITNNKSKLVICENFGIRFFENIDGVLHINGKRIFFRGVNRHDISNLNGKAVTEEEMFNDLLKMKENNFNAVRSSHYPNSKYWYDLCDKYGIYVMDEANLETHGTWQNFGETMQDTDYIIPYDKEEWLGNCVNRAQNMVETNKNHPSIIMWSCGNESYGGSVIYQMSQFFKNRDKSRLVHYEGIFWCREYDDTSDIESHMYSPYEDVEKYLELKKKPFLLCEYSHAMGNSNGNLEKYFSLGEKYPNYHGGFIWEFKDHGLLSTSEGNTRYNYGGDFLDRPNNGNFVMDGLLKSGLKDTAKLKEIKYWQQPFKIEISNSEITFVNKLLFTNLNIFNIVINYKINGKIRNFEKIVVDCPPLSHHKHNINIKTIDEDMCIEVIVLNNKYCSLMAHDFEIGFESKVFKAQQKRMLKKAYPVKLIHGNENVGIRSENISILMDKSSAKLTSLKLTNKEYILDNSYSIMPNFWRAPIDNDIGANKHVEFSQLFLASNFQTGQVLECEQIDENNAFIKTKINCGNIFDVIMTYTIRDGQKLEVELKYDQLDEEIEMFNFGIKMKVNKSERMLKWYGYGPHETYIDRYKGAKYGIHQQNILDIPGYSKPQEYGNHYGTRWFELSSCGKNKLLFTSKIDFEFSAIPYNELQLSTCNHEEALHESDATYIRINAIQTGVAGDNSWGLWAHDEYRVHSNVSQSLKICIEEK